MGVSTAWSETWTFFDGAWGTRAICRSWAVRSHATWLASTVFDGARAFEGTTPDLDLHLARVNASAVAMGMLPVVPHARWSELARDGLKRFAPGTALYIKPMYWAERSGVSAVAPDPESTRWCLTLYELPMPDATGGQSVTLSPFRKPSYETAPVDAKAACLYPNNGRASIEAHRRGFDNAVMLDMLGNVAELASANVFMAKDGVVFTPAPNGTFLDGVTRRRAIALLRADGVEVVEKSLGWRDVLGADEIFSSGNFAKIHPVTRIEERALQPGPLYRRTRSLYWDYAHSERAMSVFVDTFLITYAALFPIVNPVGSAPLFLGLTQFCNDKTRNWLARRVALNSFFLLLGSLFIGSYVLEFFGISLPVVRIGGGLVVSVFGWKLLNSDERPDGGARPAEGAPRPSPIRSIR